MDDLLREFLSETTESLAGLDGRLVQFERNPDDPELVRRLLRLVHTIKGTCGFLGLARLEAVSHAAETVLGQVRDGELTVGAETTSLVIDALARIKSILAALAVSDGECADDDSDLMRRFDRLGVDRTAGLQSETQPIGTLWATLPQLVRHLAVELGKKIEVRTRGAETALDRRALALIKDPLIHIVRNAADHGLESPAERVAAGKPETGTLSLDAYREGAHIVVAIDDDGRGLQIDEIARKAHSLGLASRAAIAGMSEEEVCAFIFVPGFSTADAITRISGRGIGMDIVRDNIETAGGTIDLDTSRGEGTRFVIRIPLAIGARVPDGSHPERILSGRSLTAS